MRNAVTPAVWLVGVVSMLVAVEPHGGALAGDAGLCPAAPAATDAAAMDYSAAIAQLTAVIQQEIAADMITGVTVALVDDQRLVYAGGFGLAERASRRGADVQTIYRVGSISKLFTAVAAMQLAEQGRLDIDEPIRRYDPAFSILNPFGGAGPTPRQIMCHRSGMVRESPVGSYFDDSDAGIDATVASLRSCVLVFPPNTKNKYSNVAPTVLGQAIGKISGQDFVAYQQAHVLGPLAMTSSAWRMSDALRGRLSAGYVRVADGRGNFQQRTAPAFELGTIPAGNLYSTVGDLARLAMCMHGGGRIGDVRLLKAKTLELMFTPQLTDQKDNFALGFFAGHYGRHRTISHMGAVYGFTSAFTVIPRHKLAVIVLNNDDINIGPVRKINNTALALMLHVKLGEAMPAPAAPIELAPQALATFAGEYESDSFWARIEPAGRGLSADVSGQRMALTPVAPLKFDAYGRQPFEQFFEFQRDGDGRVSSFTALGQTFHRVDPASAPPTPPAWQGLLGSYGRDFIPLIVSQRHGHLYAMTENMYDYRLRPTNRVVFNLPPGMYADEQLIFQLDDEGRARSIIFANVTMPRRP